MGIELVWDVARPCGSPRGGSVCVCVCVREREREVVKVSGLQYGMRFLRLPVKNRTGLPVSLDLDSLSCGVSLSLHLVL
jgi:hypothetical protein